MFKRYTTPILDAVYPAFRSFIGMAVNSLSPSSQHAIMSDIITTVLSEIVDESNANGFADNDPSTYLQQYLQNLKEKSNAENLAASQAQVAIQNLSNNITNLFAVPAAMVQPSPDDIFREQLHECVKDIFKGVISTAAPEIICGYAVEVGALVSALGQSFTSEREEKEEGPNSDRKDGIDANNGDLEQQQSTQYTLPPETVALVSQLVAQGASSHKIVAELLVSAAEGKGVNGELPSPTPLFTFVYGVAKVFIAPVSDSVENATTAEASIALLRCFAAPSQPLAIFSKHFGKGIER